MICWNSNVRYDGNSRVVKPVYSIILAEGGTLRGKTTPNFVGPVAEVRTVGAGSSLPAQVSNGC